MKHPSYRTCDVCGERIKGIRYKRVKSIIEVIGSAYINIEDVYNECWNKLEKMVQEQNND